MNDGLICCFEPHLIWLLFIEAKFSNHLLLDGLLDLLLTSWSTCLLVLHVLYHRLGNALIALCVFVEADLHHWRPPFIIHLLLLVPFRLHQRD